MQVYTTNQLAELLSSSPSQIRSQKQRNPDLFVEGEAFVRDEHGALLWTMPGSVAMAQLLNTDESLAWLESVPTVTSLTPEMPPAPVLGRGLGSGFEDPLEALNPAAEAVAWQLIQHHFHQRIGDSIRRILSQPSPAQQEYLEGMMAHYGLAQGWGKVMDTVQGAIETSSRERRAIAVLQAGDDLTSS